MTLLCSACTVNYILSLYLVELTLPVFFLSIHSVILFYKGTAASCLFSIIRIGAFKGGCVKSEH